MKSISILPQVKSDQPYRWPTFAWLVLGMTFVMIVSGCTRARYRTAADRDTYRILDEKTLQTPWHLPSCWSITPDPRSRFAQFGQLDDPLLPDPAPQLYAYDLPPLYNDSHSDLEEIDGNDSGGYEPIPEIDVNPNEPSYGDDPADIPEPNGSDNTMSFDGPNLTLGHIDPLYRYHRYHVPNGSPIRRVNYLTNDPGPASGIHPGAGLGFPILHPNLINAVRSNAPDPRASGLALSPPRRQNFRQLESYDSVANDSVAKDSGTRVAARPSSIGLVRASSRRAQGINAEFVGSQDTDYCLQVEDTRLRIVEIPTSTWENLPESCLRRMFEFATIREEYERTYGTQPPESLRDAAQRLTLEDIIELALLNSRNFQSQKEQLYRVALRLTQQRFEYQLKPSVGGNGTDANFNHNRNGGVTVNSLGVPTNASVDRALNSGGDLLARFANNVVLTFNGPTGFTANVGSDVLMNLSYSVFQRDIQLEGLTQAERDVYYAARDFARSRKALFVQFANQYYTLLLTYRGIEIESQNYLSLVRAFNEANAEFRETGQRSRIDVDQVEQNSLSGRSTLISRCNGLEDSLDNLKLAIGLPPEMPINLAFSELEQLTRRDEVTVAGELVRRSRIVLLNDIERTDPSRAELLNSSINLSTRLITILEMREDGTTTDGQGLISSLRNLIAELEIEETRLNVGFNRDVLTRDLAAIPPAPPLRIYRRTMDYVDSMLRLVEQQLCFAEMVGATRQDTAPYWQAYDALLQQSSEIQSGVELTMLDEKVAQSQMLRDEVEPFLDRVNDFVGYMPLSEADELASTLDIAQELIATSVDIESGSIEYGLVPVEIGVDDAMLTALVQRFDLQNERGNLADTWRQIKLAGDDLRSVLNLNASQTVRTRTNPNANRGFDFTLDDSSTSLSLSFDTPLNRRSQRNSYRQSLINYQAALRGLIDLEDNIKADIRADIRGLQQDREQYQISVASAALAYERVISTRLQLQLGTDGVRARDFLEAQTAYANSLNGVASNHIRYIQGRTQFFLDMEALVVDDSGFWPELYNESVQPEPQYGFDPSAGPAYGELPPQLRYSRDIRRMESIPNSPAIIFESEDPLN